jgi:hypothetical protein
MKISLMLLLTQQLKSRDDGFGYALIGGPEVSQML